MKKIIFPGLLAGLIMLIIGLLISYVFNALFPVLKIEYANVTVFRPWSDPLMNLFWLYPFILGIALAFVWDKTKSLFSQACCKGALQFGLMYFLIATIPGMLISYSSFQVSLLITLTWTLNGLLNGIVSGWLFSKFNK